MVRYILRLLFSLFCIVSLRTHVIAMDNTLRQTPDSTQSTSQAQLPNITKETDSTHVHQAWSSSSQVTLGAGIGIVVVALSVYLYTYVTNRSVLSNMDKKLNVVSNSGSENFSFQDYRITDQFSDGKFWPTAKDLLESKVDVKGILYADILQQTRIFIGGKSCSFKDKSDQIKVYLNIKNALEQERSALRRSILLLNEHTSAAKLIAEIINNKNQNAITRIGNLDQMYAALSQYTAGELNSFNFELCTQLKSEAKKWWKTIFCPGYNELSLQYWEFVKRYVRTRALQIVIDEDYASLLQQDR